MHFVPFGGSARTTLALSAYLIDDDSNDLSGTGVTADAARYCKIAMDRGRSVVTYMACTENAALIEDQFRACGFLKIRRFSGN
ncbi:MAG TPA: hypothetical protein VGZ02_11225 [Candidatus Baltobacteraceae bacterium]|nr:hypothetical protein [Candidatus Baltobacteraceae bacterium]